MKRISKLTLAVVATLLISLGLVTSLGSVVAHAETQTIFVEDEAKILSDADKVYIRDLNEVTFKGLEGSPQYAVVTLKNLNKHGSIEDYAEKKFQNLGIGSENLDNGFLFVIAVEDREYRLETGYGVEDVITDSMKDDIVTSEAEDLLRSERYGDAVVLISQNVEKIVSARYGNYAESVAGIKEGKKRNAQLLLYALLTVLSGGLLVVAWYFVRQLHKKKIEKELARYVDPKLRTSVYYGSAGAKANSLSSFMTSSGTSKSPLTKRIAAKMIKNKEWRVNSQNANYLKYELADGLFEDAVINYRAQNRAKVPYEELVYLDHEDYPKLVAKYGTGLFTDERLTKNPLLTGQGQQLIGDYLELITASHKAALVITERNKNVVKEACDNFLVANGVIYRDGTKRTLEIALMMYYLLKGKNLSNPNLIGRETLTTTSLNSAYKYAKTKGRSIEKSYRRQAISDLDSMMLGTYYLQSSMMWSSYHSSSSSSSGGGSSFGGGSSGGGGFSGSW